MNGPQGAEQLLFGCLRPGDDGAVFERLKDLSPDGWAMLIEVARELMVRPVLAGRLLSPALMAALPANVKSTLTAERRLMAIKNLRVHADLNRVVVALQQHQIPVIALKGLHLATLIYDDMAIRTIGDLDLLVRARDLARAGAALRDLGYSPMRRYDVSLEPIPYEQKHLPRFSKSGATDVEIHWHVADNDPRDCLDVNELWDRAVPARIAGVDVEVLSPEDLLLHLCIHATISHLGDASAQPWCDIAAIVEKYGSSLSWVDVVDRATRWRCRRGTYLALRLACQQAGAAVPRQVLDRLRPPHFDERILTIVMQKCHRLRLSGAATSLYAEENLVAKLRVLWRRVFLPKCQIADRYNLSRSSWLVYAFYAVRFKDLAKDQWQTVFGLSRGDPALIAQVQDTEILQKFVTAD